MVIKINGITFPEKKSLKYFEVLGRIAKQLKIPATKAHPIAKKFLSQGLMKRVTTRTGKRRYITIVTKRQLIGISEDPQFAGFQIFYSITDNNYQTVDPDTQEVVKTNTDLAMEIVASIDTKGHSGDATAEIRVRGTVSGGLSEVESKEKELQTKLTFWIGQNTAKYVEEKIGEEIKKKLVTAGFAPKMMDKLKSEIDSKIKEGRRLIPTDNSERVSGMFEYKSKPTKKVLWDTEI